MSIELQHLHATAQSVLHITLTFQRICWPAFEGHDSAAGVRNKELERRTLRIPGVVGGT
jgi:hypothetical protein